MGRRGLRTEPEHLINGLTFDERLSRVEGCLFGDAKVQGLDRDHDATRERLEKLESIERRRRMPWYVRWFVRRAPR